MKIDVVYSVWGVGDEADGDAQVFAGGVKDVDLSENPGLAKYIAAGEVAGVVRVVEASDEERKLLDSHVQSQEDGEAAYEAAQADGTWQEGNLQQFILDTEARLALSNEEANLTDGSRLWLTQGLADAYDAVDEPEKARRVRAALSSSDASRGAYEAPEAGEEA